MSRSARAKCSSVIPTRSSPRSIRRRAQVLWKIPAEDWKQGYAITAAPLYYDGLVIIGFNGGEMGTRGRLKAYDAKTGKLQVDVLHGARSRRARPRNLAARQ